MGRPLLGLARPRGASGLPRIIQPTLTPFKHGFMVAKGGDRTCELCAAMTRSEIEQLQRTAERDAGDLLRIQTAGSERLTRCAVIGRITPLVTIAHSTIAGQQSLRSGENRAEFAEPPIPGRPGSLPRHAVAQRHSVQQLMPPPRSGRNPRPV